MSHKKYVLGVDCGGTKTEVFFCDESGNILGKGRSETSNIHNTPLIGVLHTIDHAVDIAMSTNQNAQVDTICLGISGLDCPEDRASFTKALKEHQEIGWIRRSNHVIITTDGHIGLKSGTNKKYGVCLIASTGSNCFGRNDKNQEQKAGDWGYLLGDQGSGFAIGLKLIRQVMKEYDGREAVTPITSKVLSHVSLDSPLELIALMYKGKTPIKKIASLTKILNNEDIMSQKSVGIILDETISELSAAYTAVTSTLKLHTLKSFPVALVGGLFNLENHIKNPIVANIKKITPQAEVILSNDSPTMGAVKIALHGF